LYTCYSRSPERTSQFRDEFEVERSAGSYEELLEDPLVEGLLITTPNDTHRDLIVRGIQAGKAVYTDKPIAHDLADVRAIKEALDRHDTRLAVGHSARRLSGSREMKRQLDHGLLGDVSLAEANFSNDRGLELTDSSWRWSESRSPGGVLIQLGVHHADNLQYLLGPAVAVSAHARRLHTKAEIPDAVMCIIEFENGALGYLGCGWASPGVYQLRLQGTKTNLLYELEGGHWAAGSGDTDSWATLSRVGLDDPTPRRVQLSAADMFREQIEEFALAIRGLAEIEVGILEGARALALVQAALLSSSNNGTAVQVAPLLRNAGWDDAVEQSQKG
jgi:1,5-anhydro-D-fructose reductase (1,5-anhydro-D-mannitol-forming)